jgi:hypothetical protein
MAYITDKNGNYKRTVRCSHCYEKEHNKSACPKRKQDLKDNVERYTKELAENKFVHDYQRDNTERYLRHNNKQLETMANRGKNRRCGFCGDAGHTRPTCPARNEKTREQMAKTLDVRKRVSDRMIAAGFGPGALISIVKGAEGSNRLAIVESIDFKNIIPTSVVSKEDYFYGCQALRFHYVVPRLDMYGGQPVHGGLCYIPPEYLNIDDVPRAEWSRDPNNRTCTLLSSVSVSEDVFLTDEAFGNKKKVKKWVVNNIVDPK